VTDSNLKTRNRRGLLRPLDFAPKPLVSGVAHGLVRPALQPRHEGAIKFEVIAALRPEEAPHILSIPIGS
jgi:hypothetical protein